MAGSIDKSGVQPWEALQALWRCQHVHGITRAECSSVVPSFSEVLETTAADCILKWGKNYCQNDGVRIILGGVRNHPECSANFVITL